MKKKGKNVFKEKINEVEFKATQADWKAMSSQLDKQLPLDLGTAAGSSIATTAKTSFLGMSTLVKLVGLISVTAFSFFIYKNISIEKNLQNNSLEAVQQINTSTSEAKTYKSPEESMPAVVSKIVEPIASKSSERKNTGSEISVAEEVTKETIKKDLQGLRIKRNSSEKIGQASKIRVSNLGNQNTSSKERIIENFEPSNDKIATNKVEQAALGEKTNIVEETANAQSIVLETLNSNHSFLPFSEDTNSLEEYTRSLIHRLSVKESLAEKFENKRFQIGVATQANYEGLRIEFTEKVRSFPGTVLHVGLGYNNRVTNQYLQYNIFSPTIIQFTEERVHLIEENSFFIIGELKKFIWKDRLSAYGLLKPEYTFSKYGREGIRNPDNSISTYNDINPNNEHVRNLLVSTGIGMDFRFSRRMEFRFGYEHALFKTIKEDKSYLGNGAWARHFLIGLNYNFKQKIK